MTYYPILLTLAILFIGMMTWLTFRLGKTKTDNPKTAAITGFLLSFFPPFVLIYVVILLMKQDVDIV